MSEVTLLGQANIKFAFSPPGTASFWWTALNNTSLITGSGTPIPVIAWQAFVSNSNQIANVYTFTSSISLTGSSYFPTASSTGSGGVFFREPDESTGSWMSSSVTLSADIQHIFIAYSSSSPTVGVLAGQMANGNNIYFLNGENSDWFISSPRAITNNSLEWGASINQTGDAPGKNNNRINVIHIHCRPYITGSHLPSDRNPPLFSYNLSPKISMSMTAGTGSFCRVQNPIVFGRRRNPVADEQSYTGWITEIRMYDRYLTNSQTGSILLEMVRQWGSQSVGI